MSTRALDVLFALVGAAGLVLKGHYSGPWRELVHSYGGNVAASFAMYFAAKHAVAASHYARPLAAGLALAAVELFEALDGFGLMENVYDRNDFAANAAGITIAFVVDAVVTSIRGREDPRPAAGT